MKLIRIKIKENEWKRKRKRSKKTQTNDGFTCGWVLNDWQMLYNFNESFNECRYAGRLSRVNLVFRPLSKNKPTFLIEFVHILCYTELLCYTTREASPIYILFWCIALNEAHIIWDSNEYTHSHIFHRARCYRMRWNGQKANCVIVVVQDKRCKAVNFEILLGLNAQRLKLCHDIILFLVVTILSLLFLFFRPSHSIFDQF